MIITIMPIITIITDISIDITVLVVKNGLWDS